MVLSRICWGVIFRNTWNFLYSKSKKTQNSFKTLKNNFPLNLFKFTNLNLKSLFSYFFLFPSIKTFSTFLKLSCFFYSNVRIKLFWDSFILFFHLYAILNFKLSSHFFFFLFIYMFAILTRVFWSTWFFFLFYLVLLCDELILGKNLWIVE